MKLEFFQQVFEKYLYQISWISIQWEPSSVVTNRWTDRKDITKQTATFYTFANVPKSFDCIAVWKLDTTVNLHEPNEALLHFSLVLNFRIIHLHHPAVIG